MSNAEALEQTNEMESTGTPQGEFFISYSHEDIRFATRLQRDLEAAGRTVWRDEVSIPLGVNFEKEIKNRLKSIKKVLVILSPDSAESIYVRGEFDIALEMGKKVIPIIHRKCDVPLALRGLQHIDFRYAHKAGVATILDGPSKSTPLWLRLLRKFGVVAPLAALAILTAIAILAVLPSKTSVTLVDDPDAISLRLDNSRLRQSTVSGPYYLRFGTLPIKDAALDRLDLNKNKVGTFGLNMALTSYRGFTPDPTQPAHVIAAHLRPSDEALLEIGVQESDQTAPVRRRIRIPSSTIRNFVIPRLPEIVHTGDSHAN
jgi:hypothetical protein